MTSGKASKRKRREAKVPPPPVKGARGGRRASPKVVIAAAAVIVVVAIGAGVAIALGGGSSSPGSSTPTRGSVKNGLPGSAEVAGLFRGIAQHGTVLGSPSAPVSIVEYIDLQCPACQQFETQALPQLLSRYVRPGKVKLEARPIAFIGPDSEVGRKAALAASAQNRMFNFMEIIYSNQGTENTGWLTSDFVKAAAGSIPGLDVPRLLSDSAAVKDQEGAIDGQANADKVNSTPTLLVGRSGGTLHKVEVSSLTDIQSLSTAIDAALR
jgi:protein-disulfide isomerase